MSPSVAMSKKAKVDDDDIWFDGVDKRLIAIHCKQPLPTKQQQQQQQQQHQQKERRRRRQQPDESNRRAVVTKEVALDCEMVECNFNRSVLARVSIVNIHGQPLMDKYVAPPSKVTDYRTKYSGIRKADLTDAPEFDVVQAEVREMIQGKIVVGHALHNDFQVLKLKHPKNNIRDTSKYFKYYFQGQTPSLKKLADSLLGISVQNGEHDSIQDAQTAMKLYLLHRDKWNQVMTKKEAEKRAVVKSKNKKKKKRKVFFVSNT